jgi:L-fuconolactonase
LSEHTASEHTASEHTAGHETERIDAHHHVWDLAVRDQPWSVGLPSLRRSFAFEELRAQLRTAGVGSTVVVQTITVAEETPELLALADATPEIRGVVGWVDLTAPDVAQRLTELRERPDGRWLVAIRHQVQEEPDPEWLCRAEVLRGLKAVAEAGLGYDLLVTPPQLPAAIGAVHAVPQLRFVLDHGGKPAIATKEWEPWASHIGELAQLPNVAVKLSGLVTEAGPECTVAELAPYAERLLETFRPDRVMFGSDWPVCTLRSDYARVVETAWELVSGLSADARARVFGATAQHWYRLDQTGS